MIFAAGIGTRMHPLTLRSPKSLLKINNKPLLHFALELALTHPFKKIVINSHYFAEQVKFSVDQFIKIHKKENLPEIIVIYEPLLLETGGGVKNASKNFPDSIFTLNSDSIILSNKKNPFEQMSKLWDPVLMDFLLLVHATKEVKGHCQGDFSLDKDGKLSYNNHEKTYTYTGLQILKPSIISQVPEKKFSLSRFYIDEQQRIYGTVNSGGFYHFSSPKDIEDFALSTS